MTTDLELWSLAFGFYERIRTNGFQDRSGDIGSLANMDRKKLEHDYNLNYKHAIERKNLPIVSFGKIFDFLCSNESKIQQTFLKTMDFKERNNNNNKGNDGPSNNNNHKEMIKDSYNRNFSVKPRDVENLKIEVLSFEKSEGFNRDVVCKHLKRNNDPNKSPSLLFTLNTKLAKDKELNLYGLEDFETYRLDSSDLDQGGILIFVNRSVRSEPLKFLESPHYELLWVKLQLTSGDENTVIVGNVSRISPDMNAQNFFAYIQHCIERVNFFYPGCQILIQGLFNIQGDQEVDELKKLGQNCDMTFKGCLPGDSDEPIIYLRTHGLKGEVINRDPDNPQILSTSIEIGKCLVCSENFLTRRGLETHRRTERHSRNYWYKYYKDHRSDLVRSKFEMIFEIDGSPSNQEENYDLPTRTSSKIENGNFEISCEPNSRVGIRFRIRNVSEDLEKKVVLKSLSVIGDEPGNGIELKDSYEVSKPVESRQDNLKPGVRILPSKYLPFSLICQKSEVGQYRIPILAQMRLNNTKNFQVMLLDVLLKVQSPELEEFMPTELYKPKELQFSKFQNLQYQLVPGIRPETKNKTVSDPSGKQLKEYKAPGALKEVLKFGGTKKEDRLTDAQMKLKEEYEKLLKSGINKNNHAEFFEFLLFNEERQMEIDIRHYDMTEVKMTREGSYLCLDVPGLAENRPSVLRGDRILVQPVSGGGNSSGSYGGYVHDVLETKVQLRFSGGLVNKFIHGMKFNVQFTVSRFPIRNSHRALQMSNNESIREFLFPENPGKFVQSSMIPAVQKKDFVNRDIPENPGKFLQSSIIPAVQKEDFVNRDIPENKEQAKAVTNILSGNLVGYPYIVFGPPGTGKTMTIVETMKQLYLRDREKCRILACAPSNAAADIIASRLLNPVSQMDSCGVLRFYAPSRDTRQVPEQLLKVSNINREIRRFEDISQYKIVVVTLVTAGRLVTMGLPKGHFKQVFLDESGHATEPEALIPISGFVDTNKTQCILTGDPKQLGPIIRSPVALKNGLQISLLERIMSNPKFKEYQQDNETGNYNSRFITKLLDNYRSHNSILELPSKLFYDNQLVKKAKVELTDAMLGWEELPKKSFPIIFHSVCGVDTREKQSPSFFNLEEVKIVVDYIEKLLAERGQKNTKPQEIGVISPYRRQVSKIREYMNKKFQNNRSPQFRDWKKVTVGSTEEFQGQERKVIIISTVRSNEEFLKSDVEHRLGFLKNPKRFNVAITRAKALMIVVGNSNLLCKDPNWKLLIHYIHQNGGYKGGIKFNPNQSTDFNLIDEKFGQMAIGAPAGSVDQPRRSEDDFEIISERELQEAPEWRSDF